MSFIKKTIFGTFRDPWAEVRTSLDLADLFLIRATVNALISTFSMNIFHMTRNTTLIFKSFITNWAHHRLFLKASLRGIISIIHLPIVLFFIVT